MVLRRLDAVRTTYARHGGDRPLGERIEAPLRNDAGAVPPIPGSDGSWLSDAAVPGFPAWKRCLDVTLGTAGLIVTGPLLVIVAVAMRVSGDRGTLLYRAVRLGEGGRPFRIVKVRTMRPDTAGPAITASADGRITPIGRRLRRAKLDELPQLWNVVRGEMSLVGPRPEDPRFVDWSDPLHRLVFTARPGITGPTQIAYRDEESLVPLVDAERVYRERILPRKLALDAAYLRHRTLRSDMAILMRTVVKVAAPATPNATPPGGGR